MLVRAGYGMFYNGSVYNGFPRQLGSQPPFAASSGTLITSPTQLLTLQNGFPTVASNIITNTYAIDRGFALGYAQTWNASVQREIPHSIVLELGYNATKGTRLDIQRLPNRAAPGSVLNTDQSRQIGNAQGFTFESSEGNSIFHSGNRAGDAPHAERHRDERALHLRQVDRQRVDIRRRRRHRRAGRQESARRARALEFRPAAYAELELDLLVAGRERLLPSRHRLGRQAAQGLDAHQHVHGAIGLAVYGSRARQPVEFRAAPARWEADAPIRPGLSVDPILPGQYFNLAAFTVPASGHFGNAGRNTITGPALFSTNASVSRTFVLGERRRLTFSMNSTNFLNHPGISGIGTVVNSSTYGFATSAQGMRTLSMALRLNF